MDFTIIILYIPYLRTFHTHKIFCGFGIVLQKIVVIHTLRINVKNLRLGSHSLVVHKVRVLCAIAFICINVRQHLVECLLGVPHPASDFVGKREDAHTIIDDVRLLQSPDFRFERIHFVHMLLAMGIDPEDARNSIRVSFSKMNTEAEVKYAAGVIANCVAALHP